MNKIFMGKEADLCDGTITDFSTLLNMLSCEEKKDKNQTFISLITMQFKHVLDKDYFFQHRYRSRCIYFYFLKEMFTASILLGLNIIVYMNYLWTFQNANANEIQPINFYPNKNISNLTSEQQIQYLDEWTSSWDVIVYFVSFVMFCKVFFRIIFNLKKDKEVKTIDFDNYLIMDMFFALCNLMCYLLITIFGSSLVNDDTYRRYLMLLACFGVLSSICRFFYYFLVTGDISKMLLTLIAMCVDSVAFLVLFGFFHVIFT